MRHTEELEKKSEEHIETFENCKLIIDGKEFANRSAITREQALKFCTVQQRDTRMSSTLQPVAYEWVYTVKGEIFKGNMQDCPKLTSLIGKQKTQAIGQPTSDCGQICFHETEHSRLRHDQDRY